MYEFMWQHRERSPTVGSLIGRNIPRWLIVGGAVAVFVGMLYALDATTDALYPGRDGQDWKPYLVPAAIGLWLGMMLRDYGHCKTINRMWPIEAAVLDWPKLERLLWGEGESNELPSAKRIDEDAPLAAIPVEEDSFPREDRAR